MTGEAAVVDIHARLAAAAADAGGRIARVVYCPHRPDQACDCRKPKPGMLLSAAADLGLAIEASYFTPGTHRRCEIVGRGGTLVADFSAGTVVLYRQEFARRGEDDVSVHPRCMRPRH